MCTACNINRPKPTAWQAFLPVCRSPSNSLLPPTTTKLTMNKDCEILQQEKEVQITAQSNMDAINRHNGPVYLN